MVVWFEGRARVRAVSPDQPAVVVVLAAEFRRAEHPYTWSEDEHFPPTFLSSLCKKCTPHTILAVATIDPTNVALAARDIA